MDKLNQVQVVDVPSFSADDQTERRLLERGGASLTMDDMGHTT